LYRYTGQADLSVGTPIANRGRAETENLIGFFLNTLVLRARMDGELAFRDHLARVKETCLGAYAHQDMPFERLVSELDPERDPGQTPLFQVMFTFAAPEGVRGRGAGIAGLEVRSGGAETTTAKFDLLLGMGEGTGGALSGGVEYSTDLFEAATI